MADMYMTIEQIGKLYASENFEFDGEKICGEALARLFPPTSRMWFEEGTLHIYQIESS